VDASDGLAGSVSAAVMAEAEAYGASFAAAKPFKHVVIEGFFEPAFAKAMLRDFPAFDPERARNEFGGIGNKAVNERIAGISPTYARFYSLLESPEFLGLMSRLTGIADLLHDPNMFGGGTHENRHGQELDPHIDFNYDPPTKLHRRVNLLVYLNEGWQPEWGGQIELHSNPRRPDENQVIAVDPTFNRALIFETNEISWHGFPRIDLPEDKRDRSRKSLSIYLYTKDRPEHEKVPEHGTFYVQRWLPPHIREGHVLTAEDVQELRSLLTRRDSWIEHYQNAELRSSGQIGALNQRIRHLEKGAVHATINRIEGRLRRSPWGKLLGR
jgi:hypothetical protein